MWFARSVAAADQLHDPAGFICHCLAALSRIFARCLIAAMNVTGFLAMRQLGIVCGQLGILTQTGAAVTCWNGLFCPTRIAWFVVFVKLTCIGWLFVEATFAVTCGFIKIILTCGRGYL